MADPISTVASIISLLEVIKLSRKMICIIKQAPEQLLALKAELDLFETVINDITEKPIFNFPVVTGFEEHIEDAKALLYRIHCLIAQCSKKLSDGILGKPTAKVKRLAWLRASGKVRRLTLELQRMKSILSSDIGLLTL